VHCITTDQLLEYHLPLPHSAMCRYLEILSGKLLIAGGLKISKTKLGGKLNSVYIFSKDSWLIPVKKS